MRLVSEQFEGFCCLDGSGEVDRGGEDAGGVTSLYRAGGWLWEDADETGCGIVGRRFVSLRSVGEDVHGSGVSADRCGVDPGFGLLDAVVVEEIAGFEVVGGVEDEMGGG